MFGMRAGRMVGARFLAVGWVGMPLAGLWVVFGVAYGLVWLAAAGVVLVGLCVLRLRMGVQRVAGGVAVQSYFQRYEVELDDLEFVDGTVRFLARSPHLVLRDGSRIKVAAFGAQRWPRGVNEDAMHLAEDLQLEYRAD